MPTTPKFLIPYPDLDVVADVPADMRVSAERLETVISEAIAKATADAIAAVPKIAAGAATLPFTADPYLSVPVRFPAGLFTAAPRVVATSTLSYVIMSVSSLSLTGVNLWARHMNDTKFTGSVTAFWVAVQA